MTILSQAIYRFSAIPANFTKLKPPIFVFKSVLLVYSCLTMLLVSTAQCSESAKRVYIHTHISPHFLDFLPIQATTVHQVGFPVQYSKFSLVTHFIHSIDGVYVSVLIFQFVPTPAPSCYLYICSLHLCFYVCFANKITCTIFLDSIYMLICNMCFSLLIYFTQQGILQLHSCCYKWHYFILFNG